MTASKFKKISHSDPSASVATNDFPTTVDGEPPPPVMQVLSSSKEQIEMKVDKGVKVALDVGE